MTDEPLSPGFGHMIVEDDDLIAHPIRCVEGALQGAPIVAGCPHSGRHYPKSFLTQLALDVSRLRQAEDFWVDGLIAGTSEAGVARVEALFPRSFVDVNREPLEIDPDMFDGPIPKDANSKSLRVAGGLGTIARVVNDGAEIYRHKLPAHLIEQRITSFYRPYHEALENRLSEARQRHGVALLLDFHSMPSHLAGRGPGGRSLPDIVLGDRYGASCPEGLVEMVERNLLGAGYSVMRNAPYAGGYCTEHYGRPREGLFALQIEINRRLYMDESQLTLTPAKAAGVRADLTALMAALAQDWGAWTGLPLPDAAE
ncbi:MAG: N-formylglutamate amidohydrolase [Pseudomonadota bacterium]